MSKRIYVVTNTESKDVTLVRASNTIQARNAVAKNQFTAAMATQEDLVAFISAGKPVVQAVETAEEQEKLPV